MRISKKIFFLVALLFTLSGVAQEKYVQLTEIVTDSARIFTQDQLTELQTKLTRF